MAKHLPTHEGAVVRFWPNLTVEEAEKVANLNLNVENAAILLTFNDELQWSVAGFPRARTSEEFQELIDEGTFDFVELS